MVFDTGSQSTIDPTNNSGVGGEDISSPLYMHPSDNPSASLVPVPSGGVGYRSWKRGILRVLSVKNKLGFVNGECKKPNLGTPQFRQWGRCDDMVTSWILNSLAKEIADSVEHVADSFELWRKLEDRYYTRMKTLWEELSTLHVKTQCTCNCTCGAKESMFKEE
ncbi:hypothetical protein KY285_027724 [Solanum tuberosum]|nr:hypothetical protein KY285_027724 [Solanum tuberosum]